MKKGAVALAAGLILATTAQAEDTRVATMSLVEGVVVVNQGERFTQAHRGLVLQKGARVFVMEGAHAELAYEGRCRLRLESNSFLVVGDADECATGHVQVRSFGPHYAAAIGLDNPETATDAGAADTGAEEGGGSAAGTVAKAASEPAKWAVPATLSGVVLYALIAAGGGAKGTPETTPISAQ